MFLRNPWVALRPDASGLRLPRASVCDAYGVASAAGRPQIRAAVGTTQPGTHNLQTVSGLETPGNTATYRVYIVRSDTTTVGSNTVTITRPAM